MVQPIDYMSMIPQPDLGGAAIRFSSVLRQNRERDAALAKQKEAEQKAAEIQAQYRQDLEAAFTSGKPQDFAALVSKYPQQREALATSWDILDQGQRESEFRDGVNAYQALQTNPEFGIRVIEDRITAEQNAGNDTSDLQRILAVARQNPEMAANQLAFTLSSLDPDRWSKVNAERRARDLEPYERTKSAAEAQKVSIESGFLESQLAMDLEEKGWNIRNLMEDVETKRQNRKLAVLNKQLEGEQNELRRRELEQKIKDAEAQRDQAARDKVATYETVSAWSDSSLRTIDRLLQNPELPNVIGGVEGSAYWPSRVGAAINPFADSDQRANAVSDVKAILSQSFLNNLIEMKKAGATFGGLTEKEGDKLPALYQNLDPAQGETQYREQLQQLRDGIFRYKKTLADQLGAPLTPPNTPDVQASDEELLQIIEQEAPGFMDTLRGAEQTIQNPQMNIVVPSDGNLVREIIE